MLSFTYVGPLEATEQEVTLLIYLLLLKGHIFHYSIQEEVSLFFI